jgi:hypothetical protein
MVMQRIILHVFRRVVEAVVHLLNVILDIILAMPKSQETYCRGKRTAVEAKETYYGDLLGSKGDVLGIKRDQM